MQLTVVIPNYNGRRHLQKNLPAVFAALKNHDVVVIADDASTDDSIPWLRKHFQLRQEMAHLIHYQKLERLHCTGFEYDYFQGIWAVGSKKGTLIVVVSHLNHRFALTVNLASVYVASRYFVLLNNDVAPQSKALIAALATIRQDNSIFAVGMLEHEGSDQKNPSENILGGKNKLWFERGFFIHGRASDFELGETSWVSGGSGIFDTQKWLELAGFSPDYQPAYWEDIDLSMRARKRGWQILFQPQSIVNHLHESTNRDVFGQNTIAAISFKNSLTFLWTHGTVVQKLLHIIWLPYHIIKNLSIKNNSFFIGYTMWLRKKWL